MSDFTFDVHDIVVDTYAAAPQLLAKLRIAESSGSVIHAIALRLQVQVEPQRRAYESNEIPGLTDQFGSRDRWATTLKPFQWMQVGVMVQGFTGTTEVDVPLPVTYDFDVTASKFLHALQEGTVPLAFLFSGTVFTRGLAGFGVEQVPWDKEARHQMPVRVWRDLFQTFFPNSGWLRLDHDTLMTLAQFKSAGGYVTWEEAMAALLARSEESVS